MPTGDQPCVLKRVRDKVMIELRDAAGKLLDEGDLTANGKVVSSGDTTIALSGFYWNARTIDGDWWDAYPRSKLVIVKNGTRVEHPITFKGE